MWRYFLLLVALLLLSFGLLWLGNLDKSNRHRHIGSVLTTGTLIGISLLVIFLVPPSNSWFQAASVQVQQWTGLPAPPHELLLLLLHIFSLLAFAGFKLLSHGLMKTADAFGLTPENAFTGVAHRRSPSGAVALISHWFYPGLLARRIGVFALVLPVLVSAGLTLYDPLPLLAQALSISPLAYPVMAAAPSILLLELGWYLDGTAEAEVGDDVSVEPSGVSTQGQYDDLWEEYQTIWPDKVLVASMDPLPQPSYSPSDAPLPPHDDPELNMVWRELHHHPDVNDLGSKDREVLQALWTQQDVLIEDPTYDHIAPVLASSLYYDILNGDRILLLVSPKHLEALKASSQSGRTPSEDVHTLVSWLQHWMNTLHGIGDAVTLTFDSSSLTRESPHVFVTSAPHLLSRNILGREDDPAASWFERLRTVVLLDGLRSLFYQASQTSALLHSLRDVLRGNETRDDFQCVILANNRRNLQPSLKRLLPLSTQGLEKRLPFPRPQQAYVICWKTEGDLFQNANGLFETTTYLGDETVLALPAWRDEVSNLRLVEQGLIPSKEFAEEVDRHISELGNNTTVPQHKLKGTAQNRLRRSDDVPWMVPESERVVVFVRDRSANLAVALRRWLSSGRTCAFVHVISPPYLLRDYLAENVAYFVQADTALLKQAPLFAEQTQSQVAHLLLRRLRVEWMDASVIKRLLRRVDLDDRPVEEALQQLFRSVFGIDVITNGLLAWEPQHRFSHSRSEVGFTTMYRFCLRGRVLQKTPELQWMELIDIRSAEGEVLDRVAREHLFQQFLPGQVHVFEGRAYRVRGLNNGELEVEHVENWERRVAYRSRQTIALSHVSYRRSLQEKKNGTSEGGTNLHVMPFSCTLNVEDTGYYTLDQKDDGTPIPDLKARVSGIQPRSYESTRGVLYRLYNDGLSSDKAQRASFTLAALLREALPTIFPEMHPFLLVLPATGDPPSLPHIFPECQGGLEDLSDDTGAGDIAIVIVEDSQSDLGLIRSLSEHATEILSILDDYLHWVSDHEEPSQSPTWTINVDDPQAFINGLGRQLDTPDIIDPDIARDVLAPLFDADRSSLRHQRRTYYNEETPSFVPSGTQSCDFCASDVPEAEYEQIGDGRVRCDACGSIAVDEEDELREMYEEARRFLTNDMGVTLPSGINVRLTSTAEVQKAVGQTFTPTAGFDARVLGVAIRRGDRLSILVENGAPYHMAHATMVHELTHIWQYAALNYRHLEATEGLLVIEGHAVWAGLTSIAEDTNATEYIERQQSRSDVYGEGYHYVVETIKEQGFATPFDWLSATYGRDDASSLDDFVSPTELRTARSAEVSTYIDM